MGTCKSYSSKPITKDDRFSNVESALALGRHLLSCLTGEVVILGFGSVASSLLAALVDLYQVTSTRLSNSKAQHPGVASFTYHKQTNQ